jgi:uncharacterized damage-inducible protein DinB
MNSLLAANRSCLEQGIELLEGLPPQLYNQHCGEVFNSSIGGHFRHNLDHYQALFSGLGAGAVDYDARERDPGLETEPGQAIQVMRDLITGLKELESADLDTVFQIRMDDGGDTSWSTTSLRRELQFLLSHTIHHYALIVTIATRFGVATFPDKFGVAPSTIHYREAHGA